MWRQLTEPSVTQLFAMMCFFVGAAIGFAIGRDEYEF